MHRRLEIRHPGYAAPNIIFFLPANDGPDRDHAHFATVQAIGAVFTEHQGDIWLTKTSSKEPRILPDAHGLIPAGEYFLQIAETTTSLPGPFPITANFRAWSFPSEILLPLWRQAVEDASNADVNQAPEPLVDKSCRVTDNRLACENAHIIPSSEKAWFTQNEMDRHGQLSGRSGEAVADSASNQMRLTRDAHWLWDNYQFSVVPREAPEGLAKVSWYTQMLVEDEELFHKWHYRKLQPLNGRAPQYLYARFAWDVFPKLHGFLQAGQARRLIVRQPNGDKTVQMYNAEKCREFTLGQGRLRSASPTKRARRETSGPSDDHRMERCDLPDFHESTSCVQSPDQSSNASFDSGVADMESNSEVAGSQVRDAQNARSTAMGGDGKRHLRTSGGDEEQEARGRKRTRYLGP